MTTEHITTDTLSLAPNSATSPNPASEPQNARRPGAGYNFIMHAYGVDVWHNPAFVHAFPWTFIGNRFGQFELLSDSEILKDGVRHQINWPLELRSLVKAYILLIPSPSTTNK